MAEAAVEAPIAVAETAESVVEGLKEAGEVAKNLGDMVDKARQAAAQAHVGNALENVKNTAKGAFNKIRELFRSDSASVGGGSGSCSELVWYAVVALVAVAVVVLVVAVVRAARRRAPASGPASAPASAPSAAGLAA